MDQLRNYNLYKLTSEAAGCSSITASVTRDNVKNHKYDDDDDDLMKMMMTMMMTMMVEPAAGLTPLSSTLPGSVSITSADNDNDDDDDLFCLVSL